MNSNHKYFFALTALAMASPAFANTTVYGNDGDRVPSTARSLTELNVPTMEIRLADGQTNTLFFKPGGQLSIRVNRTDTIVAATYDVRGDKVCVTAPIRGEDCWHYDVNAVAGQSDTITSDRGQHITATYLRPGNLLARPLALQTDNAPPRDR